LKRFLESPGVSRDCLSTDALRLAFGQDSSRTQRQSDGTISLDGMRLEIPSRFRHLPRIHVRYASWDLAYVHMIDPRTSTVLARLYPLDRVRNADGLRRRLEPIANGGEGEALSEKQEGIAPLLRQLLEDYSATGLPPAYLPQTKKEES